MGLSWRMRNVVLEVSGGARVVMKSLRCLRAALLSSVRVILERRERWLARHQKATGSRLVERYLHTAMLEDAPSTAPTRVPHRNLGATCVVGQSWPSGAGRACGVPQNVSAAAANDRDMQGKRVFAVRNC